MAVSSRTASGRCKKTEVDSTISGTQQGNTGLCTPFVVRYYSIIQQNLMPKHSCDCGFGTQGTVGWLGFPFWCRCQYINKVFKLNFLLLE